MLNTKRIFQVLFFWTWSWPFERVFERDTFITTMHLPGFFFPKIAIPFNLLLIFTPDFWGLVSLMVSCAYFTQTSKWSCPYLFLHLTWVFPLTLCPDLSYKLQIVILKWLLCIIVSMPLFPPKLFFFLFSLSWLMVPVSNLSPKLVQSNRSPELLPFPMTTLDPSYFGLRAVMALALIFFLP